VFSRPNEGNVLVTLDNICVEEPVAIITVLIREWRAKKKGWNIHGSLKSF
jgi:hypothetical protein